MLLIGFTIPMIGNIISDFTVRREVVRLNQQEHEKFIEDIANKVKGSRK